MKSCNPAQTVSYLLKIVLRQPWLPDNWAKGTHWYFLFWVRDDYNQFIFGVSAMAAFLWDKYKTIPDKDFNYMTWWE